MPEKILLAREVALSFLGDPYHWAGNDPLEGFDCSGLMIEVLKSVGILPFAGDWTAHQLMEMFPDTTNPRLGVLVGFYKPSTGHIYHIELCLDSELSIGSAGGGPNTNTRSAAIVQDAYIKIRPFGNRGGQFRFVDPFAHDRAA